MCKNIDFIETKCAVASNSKICEFIYKPRKSIIKEEKKKYKNQLLVKDLK